jgi:hypothetical protein
VTFFFYTVPVFFDWLRAEAPIIQSIGFLQSYKNETNLMVFGILIVIVSGAETQRSAWDVAGNEGILLAMAIQHMTSSAHFHRSAEPTTTACTGRGALRSCTTMP